MPDDRIQAVDPDEAELRGWLAAWEAALSAGDTEGAAALLAPDGIWRDLLAFTWTIRTMEGREAVRDVLAATLSEARAVRWRLAGPPERQRADLHADIAFETATAWGAGRLTLRAGKGRTLLTMVADLKGHEEPRGARRPLGTTHRAAPERENWAEARDRRRARMGREDQPYALIIGGGQGGLAIAARLKALGVPALVVERQDQVGDAWRSRYRSLVLHDPVWYDHMPYLPFPEGWPVFTPKDKLGDWLEAYALALDLDVWTGTAARRARWTGEAWEVEVDRRGEAVTLRPAQLIVATGAYGPPRSIDWPGADAFEGTVLHSSAYREPSRWRGRRAVVVGSASSAHDVAMDLWEAGAQVTMVQRSPTCVVRSETLMELGFPNWSEAALARGITTERADLLAAATPYARLAEEQREVYREIRTRDAGFYDRLADAGLLLDWGEDGSGLFMKALRTASGYYIDVGCSDLIADGRVRVVAGRAVERLDRDAVVLGDGTRLPADLVVACTGYQSMNEAIAGLVSREAADAVGSCWGLGSGVRGDPEPWQGELRNMWRPTAVPNLWFHGGNLALSRFYSRILGLQIKARMESVPLTVRDPVPPQSGL